MAAPTPSRPLWQAAVGVAVASFWTLVGRGQAQAAPTGSNETCTGLNADTTCPPNKNKKTKPGNTPTWNGCGPEGGAIKIPQGYGDADYTGSCNNHDVCYEDCGIGKDACDTTFRDEMYDSCAAAYPGVLNSLLRFGCYERAYAYYQAVSQFGDDAYTAAQNKACECCEPSTTVYCNCNKTCYDSVTQCLDECKVSLGCFTGICGPAEDGQCPG